MASFLTQARRALFGLTPTEQQFQEHFGTPDRAEVLAQHAQTTQTMHAQVAARPPGKLSTGAVSKPPAPAKMTDLHCWAKFMPAEGFSTRESFGFDYLEWKRNMTFAFATNWLDGKTWKFNSEVTKVMGVSISDLEYCYDKRQQRYLPTNNDAHLKNKLQSRYQRLPVYGEDYFVSWLSIRPGQEVWLQLEIEALNAAPLKGDYLTFRAHANYKVATMDDKVNEHIRIPIEVGGSQDGTQKALITIKCSRACTSTSLYVLDKGGVIVGQINIVDNTKTYVLPIRLLYLLKNDRGMAARLSKLQADVASLKLKDYLNKSSLNQAQIQVEFEKTNVVHTVIFEEADWAGQYYDTARNWLTDNKDLTLNEPYLVLDKILANYIAKYETKGITAFKGIILVVTDMIKNPADNQGGVSKVRPLNFREALIFGDLKLVRQAYAHEIGHALGLDHTFYRAAYGFNEQIVYNKKMISLKEASVAKWETRRKEYEDDLKARQTSIDQMRSEHKAQSSYYVQHPTAKRTADAALQQKISEYNLLKQIAVEKDKDVAVNRKQIAEIRKENVTFADNTFKFKEHSTINVMDYTNYEIGEKDEKYNTFFYWQWKIMQNDVRTYYGRVK